MRLRKGQKFIERVPYRWVAWTVFKVVSTTEGDSGHDVGFNVAHSTYEVWDRQRFLQTFIPLRRERGEPLAGRDKCRALQLQIGPDFYVRGGPGPR